MSSASTATTNTKNAPLKNEKVFANFISGLRLDAGLTSSESLNTNPSAVNIEIASNDNNNNSIKPSNDLSVDNKSKFKTIKIFVASNKHGQCFLSLLPITNNLLTNNFSRNFYPELQPKI